ncbi:exonuclease SbcCD subunit D C-terminal domain-containing protein [Thermodesulfobacteriota bacterium B35]
MLLFHTSDWHIGRALYGRRRYGEAEQFLDWLAGRIEEDGADALLVAGDVFDTTTPGNRALSLYYRFLCRVAASRCRHVVIIGGNHDSPSLLNAPRDLLHELRIHVIGSATAQSADEVLLLHDAAGRPELIVCAVPFLRERDIRRSAPGETLEEKQRQAMEGIRAHFARVCEHGLRLRQEYAPVPLVVMGHLFVAGSSIVDGDGVRELHVGGLNQVATDIFPAGIDYLALGHLHQAQRVGGSESRWYSGAPMAMGFGEAGRDKHVLAVHFAGRRAKVEKVTVPCFRELVRVRGDLEEILARLATLADGPGSPWVEVVYTGREVVAGLGEQVHEAVRDSSVEVLAIRNQRLLTAALTRTGADETLDDLDELQVFRRCLDARQVPAEQRPELEAAFVEILRTLHGEDGEGNRCGY